MSIGRLAVRRLVMKTNQPSKLAHRLLWTAQILLALLFLFAGVMKLVMRPEDMQGPIALPIGFIRFIGVAEALGGLGLVLPGLTGIKTILTPLAAAGLTVIMFGATIFSVVGFGPSGGVMPGVVGVVAALVAHYRLRVAPLTERPATPVLHAA